MLDTNAVSRIVTKRSAPALKRISRLPPRDLCVSVITFGEIRSGLVRRPEATRLATATTDFFAEIDVLHWTEDCAMVYGRLRATLERMGKSLGPIDMLIAAHALTVGATLVTSDRAFHFVPDLAIEDWLES
ncbi:type II toxin-antitoxin system VapC family toxin [Mesorhizobium sp. 1B3]|uniref:type II toxin-antitoxin system VapC family toxin n=1 Tax=Mesorhizobium sp. 1B3 TaxID=3243599 RepID=UPI003D97674B